MIFIYDLAIWLYGLAIELVSPFNAKAKLWSTGRKDWKLKLKPKAAGEKRFWMHCASLGEFEQGRPMLERFAADHPDWTIVLSFFSPSGYESKKHFHLADQVHYLPLDTWSRARYFVQGVDPDVVVFVKYEFWLRHMDAINAHDCLAILTSVHLPSNHWIWKPWAHIFRKRLLIFDQIFVQSSEDLRRFASAGYTNITKAGDSRVDRVLELKRNREEVAEVRLLKGNKKLLVVGSNWPEDDEHLFPVLANMLEDWRIVVCPHEISGTQLKRWESRFKDDCLRYSQIQKDTVPECRILLVDEIGLLSRIYLHADLAYVGGGFGAGIHNILEPTVNGLQVIIGPRYHRFYEAVSMVEVGIAKTIESSSDLIQAVVGMVPKDLIQAKCDKWYKEHSGAVDTIAEYLNQQK